MTDDKPKHDDDAAADMQDDAEDLAADEGADAQEAPKEAVSDGLTQRERRAQRAQKAQKGGVQMSTAAKRKMLVWGAIIVIGGAIAYGMYNNQARAGECPDHWHSTFQVWVDDELVTTYGAYNLENGRLPISQHMHGGNEQTNPLSRYQIHWEPQGGVECVPFSGFLDRVDTSISADSLTLGGSHASSAWGGTHTANETHDLHLFYKPIDGDWRDVSASSLNKRQLGDGSRTLIAFGDYTAERLDELKAGVPFPPATGTDPGHGG